MSVYVVPSAPHIVADRWCALEPYCRWWPDHPPVMGHQPGRADLRRCGSTTALYRFYDTVGTLLYIGIAGNPGRRWEQHAGSKTWWDDVVTATIEHHLDRHNATAAERQAIKLERPVHNVAHNRRRP